MTNLKSADAKDGLIQYEAGQEYVGTTELVGAEDRRTYETEDDVPWSDAPTREPEVRPDGIVSGYEVLSPHTDANKIAVAPVSVYIGGVLLTGSGPVTLTPDTAGDYRTYIITAYNNSGALGLKATAGAASTGGGAAHSNTWGANGGPPLIPEDEVLLGWVRTICVDSGGATLGVIAAADILQSIPGTHYEKSDTPIWAEDLAYGRVVFASALPANHAGPATKKVYAVNVWTPMFTDLEPAADFVPAETTHSQSSETVYGGAVGGGSSALQQASFKVFLRSGYNDPFVRLKNTRMWIRHYEHRLKPAHGLTLGTLGISRTFPASGKIQANCTLTADFATIDKAE